MRPGRLPDAEEEAEAVAAILESLRRGNASAQRLAEDIGSGQVFVRFGDTGPDSGRYSFSSDGGGSFRIHENYATEPNLRGDAAAVAVVHENEHRAIATSALERGETPQYSRLEELRAHVAESLFAESMGRVDLSPFASIRAEHGLRAAVAYVDDIYAVNFAKVRGRLAKFLRRGRR